MHIVAMGGGGFSMEPENPAMDDFILSLARRPSPKVCFVPTASADAGDYIVKFYSAFTPRNCRPTHLPLFRRIHDDLRGFVLDQDVIYVSGGNTANLLAVWRAHGLDAIFREAWQAGTVLCGLSAGSICWFEAGVTDSFGPTLGPLTGCLGLLPGSHCPHYDGEVQRRPTYHRLLAQGLMSGWAVENGAALHFVGTELREVVSSRPGASAFRCELRDGTVVETPLTSRLLA